MSDTDPAFGLLIGTMALLVSALSIGTGAEAAGLVTTAQLEYAFGVGAVVVGVGVMLAGVYILADAVREVRA